MQNREQNWLDDVHDGLSLISDNAWYLQGLANRLRGVGMDKLANEIDDCVQRIIAAGQQVNQGVSQSIFDQVNAGQKAIHDTFVGIFTRNTNE